MDFFFSRGAAPQAYRVIAWSAGGESSRQITVTAGRAVRIGSLSGETFEILDASSGRPVRSVRARRVGQSLLISLDAQEQTQLTIESFFEEEGEWANRLGSRPGGETWQHYATGAGEALTAEVLADGGTVLELVPFRMPEVKAAEPVIPASASASGTGLSTLGTAGAGLLGIGLLAGGGGGGSSAPPPVVEPPPPVLKELLLTEASDGVLTRSELADGSEMLLRLDSGLKEGARVTIALVSPLGAVRNIRDLTISEADRADLWMSVRLDAADLTDPNVGQIAGAWTLRARLIDPQGRVGPAIEQTFQVEPFTEIAGSVTAGPVSGGIGIRLFDAQGQALALYDERDVRVDYVLVKSDGTWVARLAGNDYRGPVVIRATDLNGPAANYLDEVTASAQSLNTTLHAVAVIDDAAALAGKRGSTVFFDAHVTPLTELAARLAGATEILERSDGIRVLDSAVIRQANSDVARAFGLAGDDLLARPTPTNAAAFSTTSDPLSLSDSQKYGLVLAKLSGVDALNARSVANTLDQFETQLRASAEAGEPGTLTAIGRSLLDQGASIALSAAREGVGTFVLSGASADAVVLQKSLLGDVRIDDQIVEANGALRLLGTAAPGGALRIVRLALPSGQASVFDFTVGADGRFNVLVPRTSENDALTLVAYDVLGAELGVPLSVPVAPKVLSISRALVQGSGTPGSDVQLTLVDQDGLAGEPRTVKVDQTGLWHFRLDAGQELPLKVEARTIDDLGNVSSLARRAVGAASLGLVATRGEDGFINLSELPEPALQFEVGVPAGARLGDIVRIVVTVPSGGERILSVTLAQPDLDAGRLTLPFPLTDVVRDGPYDLAATYVGRNSSTIALNTRVVVDTLAPNTPTLASAEGLWLSGRTDSGSRVLAQKSDGTLLGHSDYAGDVGSWAIRLGRPLLAGETIQLIALDQAGNASAPLETAIQLSQVRILSVEDDAGPLRGLVFSGATIDDASPLLIGSLTAPLGSTERLVIYRNGVAVGDAVVSEKSWTFLDGNGASLLRAELSELPAGQSYTYRAQIELPGTASRVSGDFEIILSNTPIALQAPLTSAGEDGTANWRDIDEQGGIRLMYELPDRATPGDRLAAVVTNPLGQSLTLSTLVTDQHRASGSVVLLVPQAFLDRAGEHRVVSQFTSAASALTASADEVVFSVQLEAIPARSTPLDDLMIGGDLSVNYNGEAGNDTLIGGSAPDTLNGGPGTDWILGGGGDDFIYGSDRDTLAGGPGDDWFEIVTPTELRIDGDEGTNRVDLRLVYDVPAELRVDGLGGFTVDLVGDTVITGAGVYRFLLGVQPWTIVGSPLDDPFLIGGSNDDTIFGNLGDDTIDGGLAGNDLADYRDAPAGVDANLDTQRTTGGDGNDVLISIERLAGSAYDDTLSGGPGNDTLTGRGGEDRFVAQGGTDVILDLGVDRDDLVVEVAARAEAEVVQGWTASGLSRNDGEADLSSAGFAVDLSAVVSGLGWRVSNTGSATQFVGSALNDTLLGGTGDDTLRGSGGDDRLTGSVGNDFFDVDAGVDTITDLGRGDGSGSADILIVRAGASAQATAVEAWVAGSTSANYGTVDLRTAGLDIDLDAIVEGLGWRVINTGSAARFVGSQLNDTLEGGVGEDTLRGREGDDELRGGAGVDTFEVDAGVDRVMDLGLGADILRVSTGVAVDARVVGPWTAGVSSRNLGQARLQTEGHAVNLSSIVEGNGWSLSNIGAGTVLVGSGRADTISGGDGADTITGGLANDLLSGGEGADTFTVDFGIDTVTDLGRGAGPDVLVVNAG
ncbi:MAG: hypothetical protein RL322_983, partial [Pseudomonadota bacterium]